MSESQQEKYKNPFIATLTGIREQLRKQPSAGTLLPGNRLDGKTVMVDGASSGLGFAIAKEVAHRGARLIMVCRSGIPEKGEEVKRITGNRSVTMLPVDYSDLRSIETLVSALEKRSEPAIDLMILNAGVVPGRSRKTPQGLEEMFMVNYFSKFALVQLMSKAGLLRELKRIVVVSSESHRNPKEIKWDQFGRYTEYGVGGSMEHYGHNKLLLTTFSRELARRMNSDGQNQCSVFAMCPGPVNSNIAREAPALFQPLLKLIFGIFFKSPEKAAIPVIYLAASKDMEKKSFDYLFQMTRKEIDAKASDPVNGRRLWELSEKLLEELN